MAWLLWTAITVLVWGDIFAAFRFRGPGRSIVDAWYYVGLALVCLAPMIGCGITDLAYRKRMFEKNLVGWAIWIAVTAAMFLSGVLIEACLAIR